jgi:hypothetical protein
LDRWLDIVFPGILVCLMVLALLGMILDSPFGNFVTIGLGEKGFIPIHSLTVFLVSCSILFFWWRFKAIPFFFRIFLTIAFTMIGYTIYDSIWGAVFIFSLGHTVYTSQFELSAGGMDFTLTILSYIAWWGIPAGIFVLTWGWERKYLPRVSLKRVALVVIFNLLLILWLYSTGFFDDYRVFVYLSSIGLPAQDPHSWVWFIGKTAGMLSWLPVFISRKGEAQRESLEKTGQKKPVPWHRQHKKKQKRNHG